MARLVRSTNSPIPLDVPSVEPLDARRWTIQALLSMVPLQMLAPDPPNMPLSIIVGLVGVVLAWKGINSFRRK
jgi:hypothetical protein